MLDPGCVQIDDLEKRRNAYIKRETKTRENERREECMNCKEYLKKSMQAECADQRC